MVWCPHRLEPAPLHVADRSSSYHTVVLAVTLVDETPEVKEVLEVEGPKALNCPKPLNPELLNLKPQTLNRKLLNLEPQPINP